MTKFNDLKSLNELGKYIFVDTGDKYFNLTSLPEVEFINKTGTTRSKILVCSDRNGLNLSLEYSNQFFLRTQVLNQVLPLISLRNTLISPS